MKDPVTIGAIASMKKGLEPFIHRELVELDRLGHPIVLVPAKVGPGLYEPLKHWKVHYRTPWRVVSGLAATFFRGPRRFTESLVHALRHRAFVDFVLAATFAVPMRACDVLYATFADRKLYVGYYLKRLNGTPLAVMIHAYELYGNPNPRLFTTALAACDRVATVTEYNRELVAREYDLDPDRIEVTRIPVDVDRCRPRSTFVVLIVAFFNEGKGHEHLFEAVARLDDPDVEVWVAGGPGPARSVDVEAAAKRFGVEDRVAFFGPQRGPALEALYRRCDVFCLPSYTSPQGKKEGFPTVIAEAMAFGKPVISTRHVEIPRILDEVLVDEGDVGALTEALRALRDDPARREALGRHNRRLAESLFTLRNVATTSRALSSLAGAASAGATAAPADPHPEPKEAQP
jgi:colanic acid/amylovoran biosynthesis glycosyltransferase